MNDDGNTPAAARRATAVRRASHHRWTSAGTLLLGFALTMPACAACKVEAFELPVKLVGGRAVATVGINGTQVPLAVDSGAFFSILTEAAAAQLKLPLRRNFGLQVQGITGRVDAYTTRVEKLQLFNGEIPRVDFIVGGNEPGAGTMGLMGRNLLSFTDTEYDLANGVIRLVFPNEDCGKSNMAYWSGTAPVTEIELLGDDRRGKTPAIRARAKLDGSELVALFDTGATTVVSRRAARRAGVAEAAMTPAGSMYGAGRGSTRTWTANFDKFELGGETVTNNRLQVADMDLADADMLLGIDFFLSHRIYVSKQQSKMFFTYGGGPVFALNRRETAPEAEPAASSGSSATADTLARRGAASAARDDHAGALADLNRALEIEPSSAALFAQRGAVRESLKQPAKALEDYDQALALDPTQSDARVQRAWLRFRSEDREGAKTDLDLLDKALAPQAQVRRTMAYLYLSLEQPGQALEQLNQWLAAHPHEVKRDVALESRCRTRLKLGIELDQALDDCNDAVDSDSANPNYLEGRGWLQLRLGNARRAESDFARSLELRPAGAGSLYGRALAKMRLGDAASSEVDLAAARKLMPSIDREAAKAGLTTEPAPKP